MLTQFFDIKMRPPGYALCQAKKKSLLISFIPRNSPQNFLPKTNLLAQILQYAMSCANNDELIVYL